MTAANVARQCKLDRVLSFDMGGTTAKISADPRWCARDHDGFRSCPHVPLQERQRSAAPRSGRRPHRDWRRRRQHRARRRSRSGQGRAGQRRGRPRARRATAAAASKQRSPTPTWFSAISTRDRSSAAACISTSERPARPSNSHVAKPLGISVNEAALRIHDIVNESMASAVARAGGGTRPRSVRTQPGQFRRGWSRACVWGGETSWLADDDRAAKRGPWLGGGTASGAPDVPAVANFHRHARWSRMAADRNAVCRDDGRSRCRAPPGGCYGSRHDFSAYGRHALPRVSARN